MLKGISNKTADLIPSRILLIKPDAYGDLVLFEPVLRWLRSGLPQTEVSVVIRKSYLDVARLLPDGINWIGSGCDPYRYGPDSMETHQALAELREQVIDFEPDCLVAACYSKTWLEAVVASWLPAARKISLGPYALDLVSTCVLEESCPEAKPALYTEWVDVPEDLADWQKNVRLAQALIGSSLCLSPLPQICVSERLERWARHYIAELGLEVGEYVACCPAGSATVSIKTWPAEGYATVLAQLAHKHGAQILLLGARNELPVLEKIRQLAEMEGLKAVPIWTGIGGDIDHLAAILRFARLYVGNDTGALHLSAALNVPGVAVFGGGHWPRFRPAGMGFVTVVQPLPCFGCGWNCVFGNAPCVGRIPVDEVLDAVDRVIQGAVVGEGELREVPPLITDEEMARAYSWHGDDANGQRQRDATAVLQVLRQLRKSEEDRAARLAVIQEQGRQIGRIAHLEAEKAQLEAEKAQLVAQLEASETDRAGLYANWLIKIGIKTGLVSTKRE